MQSIEGFPFWVNAVDVLPHITPKTSTCLHINDIFACDVNNDEEVWTDVLLANYMIDFDWLLSTVPELRYIKNKLVILSGEKGHATVFVNKERNFHATNSDTLQNTSPNNAECSESMVHSFSDKPQSSLCENEILKIATKHNLCTDKITVLEPPLPYPYGTHHTKMALCVNKLGLRVAIFTANFIHDDWVLKSQGIYVQDFPWNNNTTKIVSKKHCTNAINLNNKGDNFACILSRYLHDCGIVPTLTTSKNSEPFLQHKITTRKAKRAQEYFGIFGTEFTNYFDFTKACVWLVASVPGSHSGSNLFTYGINRLGYLIKHKSASMSQEFNERKQKESCESGQKIRLSWQYSSQGVLNDAFLHRLISNMSIDVTNHANYTTFLTNYENKKSNNNNEQEKKNQKKTIVTKTAEANGEIKKSKIGCFEDSNDDDFNNQKAVINLQVIYPSENEVRESLEGWRGGLSLPVRMKTFHPFINSKLHRWGSTSCSVCECNDQSTDSLTEPSYAHYRVFALPHIKTYASIDDGCNKLRWFLLTSANLSQAAWGSASTTYKNKKNVASTNQNMECAVHNNKKGLQNKVMEQNTNNYGFEKLFIRSYELGVLYDYTSKLRQEEQFTITPSWQLILPTINNTNNLFTATFTTIHAFNHESKCNVNRNAPAIFLPYNLLKPTPYSTLNTVENEKQELQIQHTYKRNSKEKSMHNRSKMETKCSEIDVPWAVDALHKGKDILGQYAVRAMEEHTHYGPLSRKATVRSSFPSLRNITTSVCSNNPNNLSEEFIKNVYKRERNENPLRVEPTLRKSTTSNNSCEVDLIEVIDVDAEVDRIVANDDNEDNNNNYNINSKEGQ